jgi:hypothetical protein
VGCSICSYLQTKPSTRGAKTSLANSALRHHPASPAWTTGSRRWRPETTPRSPLDAMVLCGSGDRINMERAATEAAATTSPARLRFLYPTASPRPAAAVNMLSPWVQVYMQSSIRRGRFGPGESIGTAVSVMGPPRPASLRRE